MGHLEDVYQIINTDRQHNYPFIFTLSSSLNTTQDTPPQNSLSKPLLDTKKLSRQKKLRYWIKHKTLNSKNLNPVKFAKAVYSNSTSWLGEKTFPNLFLKICKLWMIVAVGALVMPLIVWIMIFIENTKTFNDTMHHYLGNDQRIYDRMDNDHNAGYVGNTNIPKHLGGVVFAAVFDVAMWILIIIAACSDLFWRFPICKQLIDAFHAPGLYDTRGHGEIEYFFLVANVFLKLFIVAATGSQTYTGLYPDNNQVDTPLFCLYAVMILLASTIFTLPALMFLLQDLKKQEKQQSSKA
ncbi:uncharacterized protein L203_104439 [Cryptococcus depauperatus CBS 7841]|uniref:Uncharacterized protein n=1 Tax=Cryptococcus depauperatus CBS 7841 TaxID=1295531 RepID=A0AAJ8M341_9TREE